MPKLEGLGAYHEGSDKVNQQAGRQKRKEGEMEGGGRKIFPVKGRWGTEEEGKSREGRGVPAGLGSNFNNHKVPRLVRCKAGRT